MAVDAPAQALNQNLVPVRRALLSVSDKSQLVEFAQRLHDLGVALVSTGGTKAAIADAGLPVQDVSEITGMAEMMDGRVKTLHPRIHGGLLALRDNDLHREALASHAIPLFDLLVVNLYPFEETLKAGAAMETVIENIDIGGPAMIRAGAKNHGYTTVVVDPRDYDQVSDALAANDGAVPFDLRRRMAAKAFSRTAAYDAAIATWFAQQAEPQMPDYFAVGGLKASALRYGENPHQTAALYTSGVARIGVANAHQIQGKSLSYNNLNDTDAAFELVSEFAAGDAAAVAIIKHANPCGVGTGQTLQEAYQLARRCDPVSAFGGIVACNREIDAATAKEILDLFTEVVIAPAASAEATELFAQKPNLRLLVTSGLAPAGGQDFKVKSLAGGLLVQQRDTVRVEELDLRVVTRRAPSEQELADLKFAFKVAKHVKSNAIVYAKDGATAGIGAGQMSRLDSCLIAAKKAADAAESAGLPAALTAGSVVASDAFFPFADGLLAAIKAGATAVIQPGGSMRDEEVIAAADAHDVAMVLTGVRHFNH